MAQKKNHEVDNWLARPDRDTRIVLIYGPDRGLAAERARLFIKQTGIPIDDPFALVRLEASEIDTDSGRLSDELNTVSMFSTRRLVWVRNAAGQKGLADAVKALTKAPPTEAILLIEAGDLKKGAALRATVEGASGATALPCYSDDNRSLDGLIDQVLEPSGLRMGLAARTQLKALLGGDRLASRSEIEKLALYCHGSGEITEKDVFDLIGDVSGTSADDAVNAMLKGSVTDFQSAMKRFAQGGGNQTTLLLAALRQFQLAYLLRGEVENGKSVSAVIASARPQLYFDRKAAMERALNRLSFRQVNDAVQRLADTVLESRRNATLDATIIERNMFAITLLRS